MVRTAILLASLLAVACDKPKAAPDAAVHLDAGAGVDGPPTEHKDVPVTINRDLDLLFLVDDSPSMADKQVNLRANFPNFINVLNALPGGLPNLHLGVISTDLGTMGAGDSAPGPAIGSGPGACNGMGKSGNLVINGAPITGNFLIDVATGTGTRMTNYTGTLAAAFAAMANSGSGGCGFEQHLEAIRRALGNNAQNAGFLRTTALLAIVILTDEDDCSIAHSTMFGPDQATLGVLSSFRCTRFGVTCDTGGTTSDEMNQVGTKASCHSNEASQFMTHVQDYVQFVRGLKANPADVIVAAISGPPTPVATELRSPGAGGAAIPALTHSCNYTGAMGLEVADPGVRLQQFLDGFPDRSSFSTVCQQDLSGGLAQIAQLITNTIGTSCFTNPLADIDPSTPGSQFGCTVADVTNEGKPNETRVTLPACDASLSNKPCWHIVIDNVNCASGDHEALKIERTTMPAADVHVVADCVIP